MNSVRSIPNRSIVFVGLALLGVVATMTSFSSGHPDAPKDKSNKKAARPALKDVTFPVRMMPNAAVRLSGPKTEDDYPAMAQAPGGVCWLAYVEYQPGRPIDMEQVRDREFDSLITEGHGDRIRLLRFDGAAWQASVDVTSAGLDVWRPTVAVNGNGRVIVAWAESVDGDWEIRFRTYAPEKQEWSPIARVTHSPGSDFHVVSTTDTAGRVWLAWQGWRDDNFDIHVARIDDSGAVAVMDSVRNTQANEWSPTIAADTQDNVYVAWDSYAAGNYDVRMQVFGHRAAVIDVATSACFEGRPSLACGDDGRVWIAYEEGDEQWGKDYTIPTEWGRHHGETDPAFGLYVHRTIRVKCFHDGTLFHLRPRIEEHFGATTRGNKSVPRLIVDNAGSLWLLFRKHLMPGNRSGGEVWHSFALRYDSKQWSSPQQLPNSSNLLDNRPALATLKTGVLAVYSSDSRLSTQRRGQTDVYSTLLSASATDATSQLVKDRAPTKPTVPIVHPDEDADVARMRSFRLRIGGKQLRLLRGDFHRHTEYTSHRDGDGLLEDSWRYALDAGQLDWLGNGDHDNGYGHEYHWWQIQKVTDLFHNPPEFVAAQSYERSNGYPNGHRNVIMPQRGIRPLPRGSLKGTAETGTPDTKLLYDYLRHFGGMCASHTSATGMGTDWRDNAPDVEPVVEIFQGCRQTYQSYEHLGAPKAAPKADKHSPGFVWNALAKGYRLGFQASSDHYSTHISYAVVLAEEPTRQGIIDAFKQRHCYGANDNIILIVRSGNHLMGDEFETADKPALDIVVHAPKPIATLRVIRNNRYVFTTNPNKKQFRIQYRDAEAPSNSSSYYYARVEQEDGSLAWASPMWITYKP